MFAAFEFFIGIAAGAKKIESILADLHDKLITGMITDEVVTQAILDKI